MGKSATAEVATIPLDRLAADPANPRTISDEALAGLEESVEDFGDLSGIVFNERTGQLVTGHQRLTALQRAGAEFIDEDAFKRWTIRHPKTGERFPIRVVDWDPDRQRIANLVANNPAIAGQYTAAALEQLRALEEEAGFAALRLDALQEQLTEELEALTPAKDEEEDAAVAPGDHAFLVLIECSDEKEQAVLLERFAGEGLKVKAIVQ